MLNLWPILKIEGGVMSQQDKFDRAVAALHEAMLGDAHWRETSVLFDDASGTKGSHLVIVDSHARNRPEWLFDRLYFRGESREDLAREYVEDFFAIDERIPRLMQLPDRHVVHVTDLLTERELKTSPTYNDALLRSDCQNSLNLRMDGPDGLDILMGLADPTDPDGWSSDNLKMIEQLLPHIRQFVRVRHVLIRAEAHGASFTELLDNTEVGVIYLDQCGMIYEANARARAILRQGDGLADRGGFLRAWLPADDAKLARLLARAMPKSSVAAASGSMAVTRSPVLPRFALHVNPVVVRQMDFGACRIAAIVLVVDPTSQPAIAPDLVEATLGLTEAQSRVAVALAAGSSVRDIAVATRRQESSVRWLVKQIHAKLGITRQADLVRMVLSAGQFGGPRR